MSTSRDSTNVPLAEVAHLRSLVAQLQQERAARSAWSTDPSHRALDAAQVGTWEWDQVSQRVMWSSETEQIFGLRPGAFEKSLEGFIQRVYEPDRPALDAAIQKALAEREPYHIEHRIMRADGVVRWVSCRGRALLDAEGNLYGMAGTIEDVTERKETELSLHNVREDLEQRVRERTTGLEQAIADLEREIERRRQAEAALTASEQQYQLLYNDNPSMYFTLSQDGTVLSVNDCGAEQLGYGKNELTGRSVLQVFDPRDHQTVLGQLIVCAASPSKLFSWEIQKIRKDGSTLWVRERARAVKDGTGATLILVVCEDVTIQKQIETSLRESEQAIRSLQEVTSAPGLSFAQRMQSLLELGCRRFKLPIGVYTKVHGDQLELSQVWPSTEALAPGTRIPLCQTYCSAALQSETPLSFEHAGASEWREHPGYAALGFESYIGTKLSGPSKTHGTICFMGRDPYPGQFSDSDRDFLLLMARWITGELERQEAERRLGKINECFLEFGSDPLANITRLTALCGELLGATCALYSRLEGDLLCSIGQWQTPPDFNPVDKADGHICRDLISCGKDDVSIVQHLSDTAYAKSDPNVARYHLQTYMGKVVKSGKEAVGSLCVVFQHDMVPVEADERLMNILASAIGTEEERLRAQKALQVSEERFKIAFRSSPHPVLVTEFPSGRCLEVNEAALKLFGYERDEVIGQTTLALGIWPVLDERRRFFEQLQAERSVRNRETTFRAKDRSFRTLLISSEIIELNGIQCLITVGNDITEQKQAEAALRESEERFAKAFRSSPYPIVISELESGLCLDANDAAIHLFGYRPEEVAGKTADQIGLWPTPEHRRRFVHQLKEKGAVRNVEAALHMKTGEWRHCLISAELIELNGKSCMVTIGYDVTEQRRAEEALRLTQTAVEKAADLAFWIDREARLLYVNDAACQRLGYSKDELLNMTVADVDPNYQSDVWPHHWEELRHAGQLRFESEHRTKSGERYPVEIVANHVTFEGQEYNFAFVRDISERKRTEAALREGEERWKALFEHAGVGIAQLGLNSRFLRVNARLCQTLGYSSRTFLKKTFKELTHPDDLPRNLRLLDEVVAGTRPSFSMEMRYLRSDGAWLWANLTISLVRSASGAPAYFIAVVEDISDRKRAEEALRTSEIQWHRFVADAPVGLVIVDEQRRVLSANRAFCALTGYTEQEIIGDTYALYTHPDDLLQNLTLTDEFFKGERSSYVYEKRYIRKGGDIIWVSVKTTGIELPGHPGPLLLAVVEDITQRKQAMEERERISRDLHDDVLQSLYAVGMGLETTKARLTRISRSAAKRLEGSVTQLNGVIHEVRSFIPRVQSRAKEERDFEQALRSLVGSFTATGAGDITVEIDAEAAASLPLDHQRDIIGITKEALSNSVRHGKATRRSVTLRRRRGTLQLTVSDNGKGFRLTRTRKGMGLSNMRARAKKLGARLAIRSAIGKGTRIVLTLLKGK